MSSLGSRNPGSIHARSAPTRGNRAARPTEARNGRLHHPKRVQSCPAGVPEYAESLIEETGDERARLSSVRVLTELTSGARLFRSADGHFCAQVRVGDRLEVYGLRSAGFRDRLISINFERRGGDRIVTLKMEGATTGMPSTDQPKA